MHRRRGRPAAAGLLQPLPAPLLPLLVLTALLAPALALASTAAPPGPGPTHNPTSFCKCTCGRNSTIIGLPLKRSCADCNRQFCLDYNLNFCKGKKDDEVSTACFQRDSTKDMVVVWVFVVAVTGLLAWAAVRRVRERTAAARAGYVGLAPEGPGPQGDR